MASSKMPNLRWVIAGLLFLETILTYIDFQTLAVVAPALTAGQRRRVMQAVTAQGLATPLAPTPRLPQAVVSLGVANLDAAALGPADELSLTERDYARVNQAFQVANLITFLIGGWVLDRVGVRWGMALAMAWWSVAEMMHGLAAGAGSLACFRFLFGIAYPMAYLAAAKAVSEWYPARERGLGTGIYTAGATVGATVATPLIAWLAVSFGWRYAFLATGAAGLVYLVPWLLIYRPPHRQAWLADTERDDSLRTGRVVERSAAPTPQASWGVILRSPYFWAVALGRMIGDSPWIFYVVWVPLFLATKYHLSLQEIGALAWIPFLSADLGSLGGGWVSGLFVRRGWPPVKARLLVMVCSACVLAFTFTLGGVSSIPVIIGLLSVMTFFTMAWMVNLSTIPVDAFPNELVGRVVGLTTAAAVVGQLLLTEVIGYCLFHRLYQTPFVIMSFMAPGAYVVIRLILRKQSFRPPLTVG